jgi:hypothetical protein
MTLGLYSVGADVYFMAFVMTLSIGASIIFDRVTRERK